MSDYISPIFGLVEEGAYQYINELSSAYSGEKLSDIMRERWGYGVLRTGVVFVESRLKGETEIIGERLVDLLVGFGYTEQHASDITRLFSVNNRLVNDLLEKELEKEKVIYGFYFKGRLRELGLVSASVTLQYALDDVFVIYSLAEVAVPAPPKRVVLWHPFLANLLIACETWDNKKRKNVTRAIEARGKFEARKDLVLPVLRIDEQVMRLLEEYVRSIESYGDRAYNILLDECTNISVELVGIDLLKEQPDIEVPIRKEIKKITDIPLELWDLDYGKRRDSRIIKRIGRWWEKYE